MLYNCLTAAAASDALRVGGRGFFYFAATNKLHVLLTRAEVVHVRALVARFPPVVRKVAGSIPASSIYARCVLFSRVRAITVPQRERQFTIARSSFFLLHYAASVALLHLIACYRCRNGSLSRNRVINQTIFKNVCLHPSGALDRLCCAICALKTLYI